MMSETVGMMTAFDDACVLTGTDGTVVEEALQILLD